MVVVVVVVLVLVLELVLDLVLVLVLVLALVLVTVAVVVALVPAAAAVAATTTVGPEHYGSCWAFAADHVCRSVKNRATIRTYRTSVRIIYAMLF